MVKTTSDKEAEDWAEKARQAEELRSKLRTEGRLSDAENKKIALMLKKGYIYDPDISRYLETGEYQDSYKIQKAKEKKQTIIFWVCLVSIVLIGWYWFSTGDSIPGAFHEKPNYDAKIYAYVYPDPKNSKNYHVPVDVHRDEYGYQINKIYWPNGGYTDLSNDECIAERNKDDKLVAQCTYTENPGEENEYEIEYKIELTNQKAE